ncbi:MAG: hypothetical protein R6V49_07650 [Bacteroidales bacterium]
MFNLKNLLRKDPVIHVILLVVIYALLDYEYRQFVQPLFSHLNFSYEYQPLNIALSLFLFGMTMTSLILLKPSPYLHLTSVVFVLFIQIPNLILFQYMPVNPGIPFAVTIFILLLRLRFSFQRYACNIPVVPERWIPFLLGGLGILFLIPIAVDFGFQLNMNSPLTDASALYEIRSGANRNISTLTAYSFGQLTKAILPALLLFGMIYRKYLPAILALGAMIYIFLVNPHKTYLVAIIPLFFFLFFRDYARKGTVFLLLFILAVFIAQFISAHYSIMPESMLVRRSLFTQAFLTSAHFDFFHGHPLLLSHSVLGKWITYPYHLPPPFLLGEHYFMSPVMSCNTGFIGDGFMNFGYWGLGLFMLIAAAVFHIIDCFDLHPSYYGLTFLVIFQMQNSPLLTQFITHGLLMLLIIMLFILRRSPKEKKVNQG